MSLTTPNQDTYLPPFYEDRPLTLGHWLKVYNLFMKKGNDGTVGYNSTRITSIANTLVNLSGRVYDSYGLDFSGSRSGSTFNINGGIAVVNNTIIELENFTTNFSETVGHINSDMLTFGSWDFSNNATTEAVMCVYFRPYESDFVTVRSSVPEASIVYAQISNVNYTYLAPLWVVRVTKSAGTITNAQLLLESVDTSFKIEQIAFWKNFVIDGGDLD